MAKSNRLRLSEVLQAMRLVGECRDLGNDTEAWFTHALDGVRRILRARVVLGGFTASEGFTLCSQARLILSVGWEDPTQERFALDYLGKDQHLHDPAFQQYQGIATPNITLRPLRLISRKVFETCEYHAVRAGLGIEDFIFSQRETANGRGTFSFSPQRAHRESYFDAKDLKLLQLLHDEFALLVGNVLSDGHADHLADLSPRLRQTLLLLLSGDSEKQAALRMGISRHTVHEYVVFLYKHFQVNSRAGLLAYCRQRNIGSQPRIPGGFADDATAGH